MSPLETSQNALSIGFLQRFSAVEQGGVPASEAVCWQLVIGGLPAFFCKRPFVDIAA